MALNKKDALAVTRHMDRVAGIIQERFAALNLPEDVARDFCRRADTLSVFIEKAAGIERDADGNLIRTADFDPSTIGEEVAGPLVGDADEAAYMGGSFSGQEDRELSEHLESGSITVPKVTPSERAPAPGRQAHLDRTMVAMARKASEGRVFALGEMADRIALSAVNLKASELNVGPVAAAAEKMAVSLRKIKDALIASGGGEFGIIVMDEAASALDAASDVYPHLAALEADMASAGVGSSPTAMLEAEEIVGDTGEKLARLMVLGLKIIDACGKKISDVLKSNDE